MSNSPARGAVGGPGRLSRWCLRAVLVAVSTAAGLVAVEASARQIGAPPTQLAGPDKTLCRPLKDRSGLRYELVPAQRAKQVLSAWGDRPQSTVTYSVNRYGYRGQAVAQPKPEGEFRIVVIGDSFVFGSLVDDDDTLPQQLEWELARRLGHERVRVVNLGVPGYQIRQVRETLERRTLQLEPDLVLMNLFVNDAVDTPVTYKGEVEDTDPLPEIPELNWIVRLGLTGGQWGAEGRTVQERLTGWLRQRSVVVDTLANRLYQSLFESGNIKQHQHRWREGGDGYGRVLATIDRGRELGDQTGFEFHVSMYPILAHLDDYPMAELHERLRGACEARGLRFHDFLPTLVPYAPQTLWAHEQDHHPSGFCHGLTARQLADELAPRIEARLAGEG
ncbi:SGNH/GDSL hydrolase family protein [Engelhardtia mirabilis]|uniref:SGNH hydrolase-type esterase domain-containing protein n=1 Tax=Engelhardtia mirabilis TaxID=2528011 RepID=A0A518BDV8_9BACT|nr:hypothetical protein Pla133_02330 [Planctomycetes bacterium Pla133]QDU99495.1 hypothetical protein Pla86_02330 [Planctomycetes bacterium Pla86]